MVPPAGALVGAEDEAAGGLGETAAVAAVVTAAAAARVASRSSSPHSRTLRLSTACPIYTQHMSLRGTGCRKLSGEEVGEVAAMAAELVEAMRVMAEVVEAAGAVEAGRVVVARAMAEMVEAVRVTAKTAEARRAAAEVPRAVVVVMEGMAAGAACRSSSRRNRTETARQLRKAPSSDNTHTSDCGMSCCKTAAEGEAAEGVETATAEAVKGAAVMAKVATGAAVTARAVEVVMMEAVMVGAGEFVRRQKMAVIRDAKEAVIEEVEEEETGEAAGETQ